MNCLSFLEVLWRSLLSSSNSHSHGQLESNCLSLPSQILEDSAEAIAWRRAYQELDTYANQYYNTLNNSSSKQLLYHLHLQLPPPPPPLNFSLTSDHIDHHHSLYSPSSVLLPPSPLPPAAAAVVSTPFFSNGSTKLANLFSRKGDKDINQDSMLVIEDFSRLDETSVLFCGVFDGHGPHGHFVSRFVRDSLPQKLLSCWQWSSNYEAMQSSSGDEHEEETAAKCSEKRCIDSMGLISAWKDCFMSAYELMDMELSKSRTINCVSSGTTAVSLVKLGNDLLLANVGDSRAVLGTVGSNGAMVPVQLTVDTRPDIPSEAERIIRCEGRIRALRNEPFVKRVWLPNHNAPGLAMSRVLGDFCIKRYGVISEPEVTHRRLTSQDKFIVLASDGIWDVLSNEEVVEIVASASDRSCAAEAVVQVAVEAWKEDYETSKVDDCSVVCLFLDDI